MNLRDLSLLLFSFSLEFLNLRTSSGTCACVAALLLCTLRASCAAGGRGFDGSAVSSGLLYLASVCDVFCWRADWLFVCREVGDFLQSFFSCLLHGASLDLLVHFLLSHPYVSISFVHSVSACLLSWCLWQEWAVCCCPYPAGPASVAWPFEIMYRNEQAWSQLEVPQL